MIRRLDRLGNLRWLALAALVLQILLCGAHRDHIHELAVSSGSNHAHCTQIDTHDCAPVHHDHDADHPCMICWTIAATAAIVAPLLLALIAVTVRVVIRPRLSDRPARKRRSYGHLGPRGPPVPAPAQRIGASAFNCADAA